MARSAPIIPVNAAMYRHFAIATVLITGCLAMFASGENRQAVEEHLEAKQLQAQAHKAEQDLTASGKGGNKNKNFTDKRRTKGAFSADSDLSWRPPTTARGSGGTAMAGESDQIAAAAVVFVDQPTPGTAPVGPPNAAYLNGPPPPGMSPEEYARMLAQKRKQTAKAPIPVTRKATAQETEALFAASRARSQTRAD
jgi:hypothetical protein